MDADRKILGHLSFFDRLNTGSLQSIGESAHNLHYSILLSLPTHFFNSSFPSNFPLWWSPLDQAKIDATGFVEVGLPWIRNILSILNYRIPSDVLCSGGLRYHELPLLRQSFHQDTWGQRSSDRGNRSLEVEEIRLQATSINQTLCYDIRLNVSIVVLARPHETSLGFECLMGDQSGSRIKDQRSYLSDLIVDETMLVPSTRLLVLCCVFPIMRHFKNDFQFSKQSGTGK